MSDPNPFAFDDATLRTFYLLRSLNPRTDWKTDTLDIDSTDTQAENNQYNAAHIPDPLNPQISMQKACKGLSLKPEVQYRYLINSNRFNSKLFLRDVHKDDTFEQLSNALDILDASLKEQSEDLKTLVQKNFVRYVRCKSNLDQIYDKFDRRMNGNDNFLDIDHLEDSLRDMARETTIKLKPLMDQATKLQDYKATIRFVQESKELFDLPKKLVDGVNKQDHAKLMFEYRRGMQIHSKLNRNPVVTRVWNEVEAVIDQYREDTWDQLVAPLENQTQEYFLPLMSKLMDLKVEDNPITKWMDTRISHFDSQLTELSQTLMNKILAAKKNILKNSSGDDIELSFYLNMETYSEDESDKSRRNYSLTDSPIVVEMWLLILKYIASISNLCSSFVEFWEHVERFVNNTYQTTLLNEKRKDNIIGLGELSQDEETLLQLSEEEIANKREKGENFVRLVNRVLCDLFLASQESLGNGPAKIKEDGLPSNYGFIPPRCNSLSCLRYLPKIVDPIFKFTTELAQLMITDKSIEILRQLVARVLNRCVGAISSTKLRDMSNSHILEDWEVYTRTAEEQYCITQYPAIVLSFNYYSIRTVRDMLFSYEKLPVLNGVSIVSHPSKQFLMEIEAQQIVSLESVLESILKNATKDKDLPRNSHTILTLSNLQHIKKYTFPEILQYFDEAFESNLSNRKSSIFVLLDKMETSIFGNYISGLKITLKEILEKKFHDINWSKHSSNSFRVGDYIIEALMVLVTVHSECFQLGPQLINQIFKETQIFISKYLFEAFKPYTGNISADGLLQVTVDLQFFQKVLGSHLEKETEVVLTACLQNCMSNDLVKMQTCITETEPIVASNLSRTSVQFASFH
ncbi:HBR103Cp [Eremothecium sinecaudum]|uniref:Exocyst complex component SEC5 n=1 Tax=Eremothecium sinecaudum TaxID=45286 RepID=A0A120K143_9SACH|nr:HBR103Cp [Eremothecium sinecaudum]AMD19004.1 HBR103Cp [Eremothecium sinecaudum]